MDQGNLLCIAEEAALAAGRQLRQQATGSWRVIKRQEGSDIKVEADRLAEATILDCLRAASSLPVLSEETPADPSFFAQGPGWIVDPLDGSYNYAHGIPLCAVSIALWDKQRPVLGVIYDFFHDELFSGGAGVGVFLNRQSMAPHRIQAGTMIATGFPAHVAQDETRVRELAGHAASFRKIRMIGSAALSLAWVAAGRMSAYQETGIMIWDVAAGMALVEAAGGSLDLKSPGGMLAPLTLRATGSS